MRKVWLGAMVWLAACSGPNVPVTGQVVADAAVAGSDGAIDAPVGTDAAADTVTDAGADAAADAATDAIDATPADSGPEVVDAAGDSVDAAGDSVDAGTPCQACPVAVLQIKEGNTVVPQTLLHLLGNQSLPSCGATGVVSYKWTVKQPVGSNKPLLPNAAFPNPVLQVDAAGEYEFCLDVWDSSGVKSCVPSCQKVLVMPDNAVHVELLWDTPADPDQTDSGPGAGADLDLHFAHTLASGPDLDCDGKGDPWFSNPFDCFWFNPNPGWGSSDPNAQDDPSLDLDDADGAGPENLNLASPEGNASDPAEYSIGVHSWNANGFGPSYATVTLFMQGTIVVKIPKVLMQPLDMWYVGKLHWPNVLTGGTADPFQTCLQSGDACLGKQDPSDPKGGKLWQSSGQHCITPCYVNEGFNAAAGAPLATCKTP